MSDYTLDWASLNLDGSNTLNGSAGAVAVGISTPQNVDCDNWSIGTVAGQNGQLVANCVNEPIRAIVNFAAPAQNLSFALLGVDSDNCTWDDRVTIIARDANGNIVPVVSSDLEKHHTVSGNQLDASGDAGRNDVTVTIAGPLVRLEIILENGNGVAQSGMVGVGDLSFDAANLGGTGDDRIDGQARNGTFFGDNGGDNVIGGEDPDGKEIDGLDQAGSNVDFVTYNPANPNSGVVTFLDGSTMSFAEIGNVGPCLSSGIRIATPRGERPVEDLQVGDKIITRDNGIQEIVWVGHKVMTGKELAASPHLKPILIKAGALGQGLPERDMLVSPNHRLLVAPELTQLYFEEREVLAAAKHMVGAPGIMSLDVMVTTYVHFMFERHEVVLSNGAWTESFQPGDYSLKGIGNSQRNEIFELFPELATKTGLEGYHSASKELKKHEARLLVK